MIESGQSGNEIAPWLYHTNAGIPVDPSMAWARGGNPVEGRDTSEPGEFPFTRGNNPTGYRKKLWTFRQYSGFGSAEESNARYKYLLSEGATGLSVAFDLPTQCGFDSDDDEAAFEVGRVGVAIDSVHDMARLFEGIDLGGISVSFTINGTAAIILAYLIAAAEDSGVPRKMLRGTIQNDILKEYASRGTWIWPATPSLRLIGDTIEFCASEVPRFNAVSVAGAHFRDAGATAVQEMAFTLQDGLTYCDEVVGRGKLTIDEFAPQISFFFYTHGDFFEEVAKYRAGRRRWATLVKERYGARTDRAAMFRMGCVCGGASLYAPEPQNNIVRVAYEALASVLGGVQSMFTAAWDEPFALPSEGTTTLALRTQQILAYETGVARVPDPLGGSHYVERLTDETERRIQAVMEDLEQQGGMVRAIEAGVVQRMIAKEAFALQKDIESGARPVIGVNMCQSDGDPPAIEMYKMSAEARAAQVSNVRAVRRGRDQVRAKEALGKLRKAAASNDENLMPILVECAHAEVTVGEITMELKDVWGEYQQPVEI